MKFKFILCGFSVLLLIACVTTNYTLQTQFNAEQAKQALEGGKNTIKGEAFMRQNGGGVVTCAGYDATLIPDTTYAQERMNIIYGNTAKGYNSVYRNIRFNPDNSEYYVYMKKKTCSSRGEFEFQNIKDGSYYIVARVVWHVGNTIQGGNLMERVMVKGGEVKEIILAN